MITSFKSGLEQLRYLVGLNLGAFEVEILPQFVGFLSNQLHDQPFCIVSCPEEPHRVDPRKDGDLGSGFDLVVP